MVNIDSVYQKVLAISNKEQRGYITPQEFNLLADKAQNEIYESYFGDIKTAYLKPDKTQISEGDPLEKLQAKLSPFITQESVSTATKSLTLPIAAYRLTSISRYVNNVVKTVEEVSKKEFTLCNQSPLLKATLNRSIFKRVNMNTVEIEPTPDSTTYNVDTSSPTNGVLDSESFLLDYYKKPTTPKWAFVVVSDKALFDATNAVNFELHGSEEEILVSRVLNLAGIIISNEGMITTGAQDRVNIKAEQNN